VLKVKRSIDIPCFDRNLQINRRIQRLTPLQQNGFCFLSYLALDLRGPTFEKSDVQVDKAVSLASRTNKEILGNIHAAFTVFDANSTDSLEGAMQPLEQQSKFCIERDIL